MRRSTRQGPPEAAANPLDDPSQVAREVKQISGGGRLPQLTPSISPPHPLPLTHTRRPRRRRAAAAGRAAAKVAEGAKGDV